MRYVKRVGFVVAVGVMLLASRSAKASEDDQLMYLNFSGPVEVPGQVLPAGTYQFKLADPDESRKIVEILSRDGSKVYALLLTIPEERAIATDEPVVTFRERTAGSTEAIRAVFYPGETGGMEFVYPKDGQ
jgi:hypothetical protein